MSEAKTVGIGGFHLPISIAILVLSLGVHAGVVLTKQAALIDGQNEIRVVQQIIKEDVVALKIKEEQLSKLERKIERELDTHSDRLKNLASRIRVLEQKVLAGQSVADELEYIEQTLGELYGEGYR